MVELREQEQILVLLHTDILVGLMLLCYLAKEITVVSQDTRLTRVQQSYAKNQEPRLLSVRQQAQVLNHKRQCLKNAQLDLDTLHHSGAHRTDDQRHHALQDGAEHNGSLERVISRGTCYSASPYRCTEQAVRL